MLIISHRCLAIARGHALLSNTKNALALFSRALEYSSSVATSTPSSAPNTSSKLLNLEITPSQASYLQNLLEILVCHHRALAELDSLVSAAASSFSSSANPAPPLVERLDEYPALGSGNVDLSNLVTYPPKLEPVPVKPLFLDVAWNYIEYPGRRKRVGEVAGGRDPNGVKAGDVKVEEKKEGRKGWFGFGR